MRKGRDYNVWKDDWTMVSLCEWVASVKAGKRAGIVQVLGKFGENRTFLQLVVVNQVAEVFPCSCEEDVGDPALDLWGVGID